MKKGQIKSLQGLLSSGRPLVVGTIHERSALQRLRRGSGWLSGIDLLEVRLDCLNGMVLPETWPLPVIATARHPQEGGEGNLSQSKRAAFLEDAVTWASAIDVELRSSGQLAPVIAGAHQHGRTVILSHHDFKATPTLKVLRGLAARAADGGADLFKVAAHLRDRNDLLRLIEFQSGDSPVPVVTMGMGNAGRFSRLVLGGFGAPICYGWLGKPQVPGQWPAAELRGLLDKVLPA
jgi:3-dehydroquinate dehydratase-1